MKMFNRVMMLIFVLICATTFTVGQGTEVKDAAKDTEKGAKTATKDTEKGAKTAAKRTGAK